MEFKNRELVDRPLFPVGVNVLVIRDGKILLGRRKGSDPEGAWGLPGGHLEEQERMLDCAARELEEETGLTAASFTFAIADNDAREQKHHYVHFGFLTEGVAGEPTLREPDRCYGWEWFPLDKLPSPLFVGHKKMIEGFVEKKVFVE